MTTIGSCISVRRRHWLVEENQTKDPNTLSVVCIDDDAQGQQQTVIPECEIDLRLVDDEAWDTLGREAPSDPSSFSLYLQNLQWNTATSADQKLFQSPFRAGIELSPYQLVPLAKALDLPRVNLMIADDVGLGKTIEAALVMRELMLRRRLDFFLVAAPASMTLQWKEELSSKFGISSTIVDRDFYAEMRAKRGFAYNPWHSSKAFIISHTLLRDPSYMDGLLAVLGDLKARSMLILDEAHHMAPSHGQQYGVDSQLTGAARDLCGRFEHRLFLTATPHNGHSNSFSALLEMLDPQRFTRGIPVSREEHSQVIVRRLKSDLREMTDTPFPKRTVQAIELSETVESCNELQISDGLQSLLQKSKLPFQSQVRLQQRLMSCVHAFALTLDAELKAFSEEHIEEAEELLKRARSTRTKPDAKTLALAKWIETNLGRDQNWNDRRLIIFTEFTDTLDWLKKQLLQELGLSDGDDRIECFTGSTSIDERALIKARFNSPPDSDKLRILLCTDAAREGINLQHRCYDLFHFDLPWNPSRLEQRNGRIDRRLQPEPEVFCRYFIYKNRESDRILDALVRKTERINAELGEVGTVVAKSVEDRFQASGIWGKEAEALKADLENDEWLEAQRRKEEDRLSPEQEQRRRKLAQELDAVGRRLEQSRKQKAIAPDALQNVVLNAADRLAPEGLKKIVHPDGRDVFEIDLHNSAFHSSNWSPIFDQMMVRPMKKGESIAEYKERVALKKISFYPIKDGDRLDSSVEQLHIEHRLVKRLLSQFEAQGFRSRLERTAVLSTSGGLPRCVLLGRLSLYAKGAASLHSEIVPISASVSGKGVTALQDEGKAARAVLAELAEAIENAAAAPQTLQETFKGRASMDAKALKPILMSRAELIETQARDDLSKVAEEHAASLKRLLEGQRETIKREIHKPESQKQADFFDVLLPDEEKQRRQDEEHWQKRLAALDHEIETEPQSVREMYDIVARRLEPVGLVYLLPEGFSL